MTGYAVLCTAFGKARRHWAEVAGLSYAAGAGGISVVLFDASLVGMTPHRWMLACIGGVAVLLLAFNGWKTCGAVRPITPGRLGPFKPRAVLGLIGIAALLPAIANVYAATRWPLLFNVDAFAIWLFKTKCVLLFPLRPLPVEFCLPNLSYSHQDYPLGFPFLMAGLFTAVGRFDERLTAIILLPVYLAVIAVVYSGLRRMHSRGIAVALVAIFASARTLTTNAGFALAETPLILMYSATLVLLLEWMEEGTRGALVLAGLFAAITAFTKNEGLALLPVLCMAAVAGASSWRRQWRQLLTAGCACAVAIGPWLVFRRGLPKTHENYGGKLTSLTTLSGNLPRLGSIMRDFLVRIFWVQDAGLIWIVLLIVAAIGFRGFTRRSVLILWMLLVVQLLLYVGTFLVTPWDLQELIPIIGAKLLVQATPVVVLLIGLHLREVMGVQNQQAQLM